MSRKREEEPPVRFSKPANEWQWWLRHYEEECRRLGVPADPKAAEGHYHRCRSPLAAALKALRKR